MWRETNLWGVFFAPLVAYMAAAALAYLPVRMLMLRLQLFRWTWNPPLAGLAIYLCILGALIGCL